MATDHKTKLLKSSKQAQENNPVMESACGMCGAKEGRTETKRRLGNKSTFKTAGRLSCQTLILEDQQNQLYCSSSSGPSDLPFCPVSRVPGQGSNAAPRWPLSFPPSVKRLKPQAQGIPDLAPSLELSEHIQRPFSSLVMGERYHPSIHTLPGVCT